MKRRLTSLVALPLVLGSIVLESRSASAQMGLEPGTPQAGSLPGGVTPGIQSQSKDDWRFDFHGYFTMPFWAGIGTRDNPAPGQSSTVMHAPPVIPGERGSFGYTNVLQNPWTQLNFSYGTSVVRGTVIIAAKTASSASGYFNPPDHIGIKDVFLTLDLPGSEKSKYTINAGVFTNRYGTTGEFDEGIYATPIAARVEGAGITATGRWSIGDKNYLLAEGSVMGDIDKPVLGTVPEGWNGFASANTGSTYAAHGHLGASFKQFAHVALHGFHSFARDNQAAMQSQPDAELNVLAGDLRFTMGGFGHLFVGGSHANATTVQSLGSVVRYLDTVNGLDLMNNYLGRNSNGTGKITTVGLQYDLSLAALLHRNEEYSGNGPDVRLSLFGMLTTVDTTDKANNAPVNRYGICNVQCQKFGAEVSYKPFAYVAAGARVDQVDQAPPNGNRSFTVLSPRIIFTSDWNSQDQIVLQYSYYAYGSQVAARSPGYDPNDMTYAVPDSQTVSLHANMWW